MPDQAQSLDSRIGLEFSHYRIIEEIGRGGMGVVFRAHDQHLDREVAIKVLTPGTITDESARKHLRKEALALSKLNHHNIATVYDFDTQRGVDFLVMEYIPGITLREKLAAGPLPEKEVLRLGVQLAEGLSAAHEHGVVHRDLKPGNLQLTTDGRLKILDFGLAKLRRPAAESVTADSLSETRATAGTLPYMAPEQLLGGEIDDRTDIHAAGLVLYEMATGQRPFAEVESSQLIGAILRRSPRSPATLNPGLSPELERIIGKCQEKEPENRYQSAKELAIDLRRLLTPSAVKLAEVPAAGRKLWKVLVSAVMILVAAAIGGTLYFRSRQTATRLTDKDAVMVADFTNMTGDPVFDGTLRQGLTVQLEQSPFLSLISDQRIQQTLRLMGQPPDVKLTAQISREICQRTASAAVLEGSIAQIGTQYLLTLKAVNCLSGESLVSTEAQAGDKNHVLDGLGKTASEIRNRLGESLSTVQKFDTPLQQATTPSLEALQVYSLGRKALWGDNDSATAVPLFQQAIRMDPNFAMAYAVLGQSYTNIGETILGRENTKKAYELRERVSEREKFYIESHYHDNVTGDLEKARQVYELWAQVYPRDSWPRSNLAVIFWELGQYDKALWQARESHQLEVSGMSYAKLVIGYVYLNRLEEARATVEEAQAKKLDSPGLHIFLYLLAFLKNDAAGMAQQVAWAADKPRVEDVLLGYEADTAAYSGRLRKAREFSRRAVALAERAEKKEAAAGYESAAAVREALFGNAAEARQWAAAALALSTGPSVQYGAALALAIAGDAARAQALANDLGKRFPEDTLVQFNYLPTLCAQLALNAHDSAKSIEALQAAAPYELGSGSPGRLGPPYPVYVRGAAYLAGHQGDEAAAEFQKILDHRGVLRNRPIGALAHLGLARAYVLQGDAAKARTAFQDFLTLWKDADPDIPILIAAKSEYAKLQ
jgi:predicted Zn-dependent protease/predicted Ser/Thr protein kinase